MDTSNLLTESSFSFKDSEIGNEVISSYSSKSKSLPPLSSITTLPWPIVVLLESVVSFYSFFPRHFFISVITFLFTSSSVSIGEVSSGNYYINLSKVSQLVYYPFYVISLCITLLSSFAAVIYFLLSYLLFEPSSISTGEVSSGPPSITLSKIYRLVYFSFSVIYLFITPSYLFSAVMSFSS